MSKEHMTSLIKIPVKEEVVIEPIDNLDFITAAISATESVNLSEEYDKMLNSASIASDNMDSLAISYRSEDSYEKHSANITLSYLGEKLGMAESSNENLLEISKTILFAISRFLTIVKANITKWMSTISILLTHTDKARDTVLSDLGDIARLKKDDLMVPLIGSLATFSTRGRVKLTYREILGKEVRNVMRKYVPFLKVKPNKVVSFTNASEFAAYFKIQTTTKLYDALDGVTNLADHPPILIPTGRGNYTVVILSPITEGLSDSDSFYDVISNYVAYNAKDNRAKSNYSKYLSSSKLAPTIHNSIVTTYSLRDNKLLENINRDSNSTKNEPIRLGDIPYFDIGRLSEELSINKDTRLEIVRTLGFNLDEIDKDYIKAIEAIMNSVFTGERVVNGTKEVTTRVHSKVDDSSTYKNLGTTTNTNRTEDKSSVHIKTVDNMEDVVYKASDLSKWLSSKHATLAHRKAISAIRKSFHSKIALIEQTMYINLLKYRDAMTMAKAIIEVNDASGSKGTDDSVALLKKYNKRLDSIDKGSKSLVHVITNSKKAAKRLIGRHGKLTKNINTLESEINDSIGKFAIDRPVGNKLLKIVSNIKTALKNSKANLDATLASASNESAILSEVTEGAVALTVDDIVELSIECGSEVTMTEALVLVSKLTAPSEQSE